MMYAVEGEMAADVVHHCRQQADGLVRHSGQGIEHGTMGEEGCRETEYHPGSGAFPVDHDLAGVGHHGLVPVDVGYLDAPVGQYPLYHLHLSLMEDGASAVGELSESLLGDIVLGGSESARNYHYIVIMQQGLQALLYVGVVIADGDHTEHFHAYGVEPAGYGRGIGVDDLADENLIADGADGCSFHYLWDLRYLRILRTAPGPL